MDNLGVLLISARIAGSASQLHPLAKTALKHQQHIPFPHNIRDLCQFRLVTRGIAKPQNRTPLPFGPEIVRLNAAPTGPLVMRIHRPDESGSFPTVVFFHGGGFVFRGHRGPRPSVAS